MLKKPLLHFYFELWESESWANAKGGQFVSYSLRVVPIVANASTFTFFLISVWLSISQ